jgi:hypothetical protein
MSRARLSGTVREEMRRREFAYADVFRHPEVEGGIYDHRGHARTDLDPAISACGKNESNCTVFLSDGTWLSTWGQGYSEGHPQERIVFSLSSDTGRTWTPPAPVVESRPEKEERAAYGIPFVVPETDRVYVFFFVTALTDGPVWVVEGVHRPGCRRRPEHGSGRLYFVFSDDRGANWSRRVEVPLPNREVNVIPGRVHGWVNHPPVVTAAGDVFFTISSARPNQRCWQLGCAEVSLVHCVNILEERDPAGLEFELLPEGPRGIRVDARKYLDSPALRRLTGFFDGWPEDVVGNFQELTLADLPGGRLLGVGRTYIGSPGFTVSSDRGRTWTPAEALCYRPGGEPIAHPMTMCPVAKTTDGRFVLLFTNNDGTARGARHVWHGGGRTRNPQWIAVGRAIPGEERNAGLVFGEPMVLAEVEDSGPTNLKTGISMPQFLEREGRFFVVYNINKEHILLDELPGEVIDGLTPDLRGGP